MMDVTELRSVISEQGSIRAAARFLNQDGMSERNIRRRLKASMTDSYTVQSAEVEPEIDIQELLARRSSEYQRKARIDKARRWHTIHMKSNAPIGLGIIGDLHLDDDGTDIDLAFAHAELFNGSQPGLYAGFLGDIWNNWCPGRLQRLWADQSTSGREAQALVEHYFETVQLLFAILGNHDLYNGKDDILSYMLEASSDVTTKHGQRIKIVFPNGKEVRIQARHTFPGRSQWVTQFGALKAAQLDGSCDIYTAGHIHCSGYSHGWHEGNERMWHALQVASYKTLDDYPLELGLPKRDLYQCPVTLIDPHARSPINFIRFEFDPFEGSNRLQWMRSRV